MMVFSTPELLPIGPNLIANGDMEAGDPPTSWSVEGTGASIAASVDAYEGLHALQLTRGSNTPGAYQNTAASLEIGAQYRLKCYAKRGTADKYRVQIYNITPFAVLKDFGEKFNTDYEEFIYDFTAQYASRVSVYLRAYSEAGETSLIDDVSIRKFINP